MIFRYLLVLPNSTNVLSKVFFNRIAISLISILKIIGLLNSTLRVLEANNNEVVRNNNSNKAN